MYIALYTIVLKLDVLYHIYSVNNGINHTAVLILTYYARVTVLHIFDTLQVATMTCFATMFW